LSKASTLIIFTTKSRNRNVENRYIWLKFLAPFNPLIKGKKMNFDFLCAEQKNKMWTNIQRCLTYRKWDLGGFRMVISRPNFSLTFSLITSLLHFLSFSKNTIYFLVNFTVISFVINKFSLLNFLYNIRLNYTS
jgi:hypothetical protein